MNSIKLYHEVYGQGETLVLIPGRLTTIGEIEKWVQALAKTRQVIAAEMPGHGRPADTDRPRSFATMGDDIAALLNYLEIPRADLVGNSFGGASAIRAGIRHPDKVRRLVVLLALCQVRLVSRGAERHEPDQRVNGRKQLVIPVLLVFADNDSVSQKHMAEFFALLGGGVKEPGWLNTQLSNSRGWRSYLATATTIS